MTSSLRRSSRAVSLCDRFKFSSQRRLCVLLTTILRPSVPGEPSSLRAYSPLRVLAPSIDRGTYSSTALRASQHATPFRASLVSLSTSLRMAEGSLESRFMEENDSRSSTGGEPPPEGRDAEVLTSCRRQRADQLA